MIKTVVFESSLDGHRRHYLSIIDKIATEDNLNLVYYLPLDRQLKLSDKTVLHRIAPHSSGGIGSALARLRYLVAAIMECRPDRVLIPTGDGLSQFLVFLWPLLFLTRCRVICVLHRAKFGYTVHGMRQRGIQWLSYLAYGLSRRCSFLSVDEVPVEALHTGLNPLGLRLTYLPDPLAAPPVKSRDAARRELGLPLDLRILGCIGVIDRRKGVHLIIKAADRLDPRYTLLLAGKFDEDITAQLRNIGEATALRFRLENRFLGEQEMFTYICALDGMLMLQPGHTGISSFALHSVKYGIPLACSDTPWFRLLLNRFPTVVTMIDMDEDLAPQINDWAACTKRAPAAQEEFAERYSVAAFRRALVSALK